MADNATFVEFGDGLSGKLEVGDIDWSIFKDESKIHYIGILNPPRFGVTLFTTMMEHMHFPPGTKKNGLFWLQFLNWGLIASDSKTRRLETFSAKQATISKNKKIIEVEGKKYITPNRWDIQSLGWMISSFPAEYKPRAEACLKHVNMIGSPASPILSKFRVPLEGGEVELPFIAAVKSYKIKQSNSPNDFKGPIPGSVVDLDAVKFFPVEGPNIFTIENGTGDHGMMNKIDMKSLVEIEHQLCEEINGMSKATPEEKEKRDRISKEIAAYMRGMMKTGKAVKMPE